MVDTKVARMKYLVTAAFLIFAVAEATHERSHTLRKPRFMDGLTYIYEMELNVTAGVLGLSSQVSASVVLAEVKIHKTTKHEHILKIENVRISGSVSAIDNKVGDIPLRPDRDLEDRLSSSIKFDLENGKVTRYSLSRKDNLVSKKIKKSILRSLEMYVPEYILEEIEKPEHIHQPIMYNSTENTHYGIHRTNYIITTTPDVEFPAKDIVYNISRFDNCEDEWYPGFKLYSNFQKQGCPEVCRQPWERQDNEHGAGCPGGFEPHQSPIKTSFSHKQSLSLAEGSLSPEIITTVEAHFAKMYDQDMEVLISYHLRRTEVTDEESLDAESGQNYYDDLHKIELEINEDELDQLCNYKKSYEGIESARNLLRTIAALIVQGEPSSPVGKKVVLLREVLTHFTLDDFSKMSESIPRLNEIQHETDDKSVERQVWLEILPLVGTPESVKFMVRYIGDLITSDEMLTWEAKEMVEALPQNIQRADEEIITEIQKLLENTDLLKRSALLYSAVHLSIGRIIGKICGHVALLQHGQNEKQSWIHGAPPDNRGLPKCPDEKVNEIVQKISDKLKETSSPEKMAVYINSLTHTGVLNALREVVHYVHGTASNMQGFSKRLKAFTRTSFLHSLRNIADRYPEEVMEIALPIFFNEKETAQVRTAAFSVVMRCQPSLGVLEKIATHSWREKRCEVGSYVYSTLETFGNSSIPCMQLLSHRIKEVLPLVKRFNIGLHHAKNHMWTYFDTVRQFGLEGRIEHTPSNASIISSTFYHSLSYIMDSLKDNIFQNSLNVEGLTQEDILKMLFEYMDVKNIQPLSKEKEIFGEGKKGLYYMALRTVEDFRLVTHQKLFYKSSYYYFDASSLRTAMEEFSKVLEKYLKKRSSKYSGYLVKLFLPSSYHTVAVARALPYPVEFQMRQPIIFSLGIETSDSMRTAPTFKDFDLHLKPSIHMSKIFTHQLKNIGDCKEVGVYYVHKVAMSYPFEIMYNGLSLPNIVFKYKVPETPNKIMYYWTEAGTYSGKKELESLPLDEDRKPIRTIPMPFKFVKDVNLVGLPPFRIEVFTEDMNLFRQKLPRTPAEALDLVVRNIMNTGWRYKSVNITFLRDRTLWTEDNEVTFKVEYSRKHVAREDVAGQSEDDCSKKMEIIEPESLEEFSENAKAASNIINLFPHICHTLEISASTNPLSSTAHILMKYNQTYDKSFHRLHLRGVAKRVNDEKFSEINLHHVMIYKEKPDEFHYDHDFGKQTAYFRTGIDWLQRGGSPCECYWEKLKIALHGCLRYESNKLVLKPELADIVKDKHFLPETRNECLRDVSDGNPLSPNCVKAIREHSAFNKMNLCVIWDKGLPQRVTQVAKVMDTYVKHFFFEHLELEAEENHPRMVEIKMKYINKFVDEPVSDWEIKKPSETLTLRRISTNGIPPLSSVYQLHETALLELTNNTYPARCVLSENYVQTYDLVTYPFKPENCHYVLTTHCTKNKNFAVILKGSKEIHIYVASTEIVLSPKADDEPGYLVEHDGRKVRVFDPVIFNEKSEIYAYLERYKSSDHIRVVARKAGVSILYDRKNVKIEVSPTYKGEMCGLCSEFDGKGLREFRGIDRCLYRSPFDFANSALVHRTGRCNVHYLRAAKTCGKTKKPSRHRAGTFVSKTIVDYREDKVCFSVRPISLCRDDEEPRESKSQEIGFYCLPENDAEAKLMIEDAKLKPLAGLEEKPVDYMQTLEVHTQC